MKFERNEIVRIKANEGDEFNERGRVTNVFEDGTYWVSNLNMPFMGTVNGKFREGELEKV